MIVINDKIEQVRKLPVLKVENGNWEDHQDLVVIEEPLEIQIQYFCQDKWLKKSLAITMRTPGNDAALAIGFLFSEGIIAKKEDLDSIERIDDNVLIIKLVKAIKFEIDTLNRHFYSTSSCGVCGKASIEKLEKIACFYPRPNLPKIDSQIIQQLPELLRNSQAVFDQTGGIHASALFSVTGELLRMYEDVGRHNAVDKLLGDSLQKGLIPLRNQVLVLSGRISFELVQKAMMAGIPIIVAVGAPSSLAVELALEADITLIGFLRGKRFNVYCGRERIIEN